MVFSASLWITEIISITFKIRVPQRQRGLKAQDYKGGPEWKSVPAVSAVNRAFRKGWKAYAVNRPGLGDPRTWGSIWCTLMAFLERKAVSQAFVWIQNFNLWRFKFIILIMSQTLVVRPIVVLSFSLSLKKKQTRICWFQNSHFQNSHTLDLNPEELD